MISIDNYTSLNKNQNLETMETNYELEALLGGGLTKKEALKIYALLKKVQLAKEDVDYFEKEMNAAIPFEGGMSFSEALIGLRLAID